MRTATSVGLLTGGGDRPYAFGLAMALTSKGMVVDFIGSDELDHPTLRANPKLNFLNLRGSQDSGASLLGKVSRILRYYARLIHYVSLCRPSVLHILWNNKFEHFDRTLLMLYYKLVGKRVVLTAHNINAGQRDSRDSALNRLTLRIQYRLADHIFVHTDRMKTQLVQDFRLGERDVSVIPFGINNSVPRTDLTAEAARRRLGIGRHDRTMLFFGNIGPYKGLQFLVAAFHRLAARAPDYRLLIVGQPMKGHEAYFNDIQHEIASSESQARVIQRSAFIPDDETELYFKAADLLVLPYTEVFQSGVLILGYSFGVPAVATDVGSFRDDVVEGETGFLCRPRDPIDLATTIERYFRSDLFSAADRCRTAIRDYARARYSWETVSTATCRVYKELTSSR